MTREEFKSLKVGDRIIFRDQRIDPIIRVDGDVVYVPNDIGEGEYSLSMADYGEDKWDSFLSDLHRLEDVYIDRGLYDKVIDQCNDLSNQLRNTQSKLALSEHRAKTSIDWSARAHELTLAIISALGDKWDVESITQCVGELLAYQKGCCDE